MTALRAVLGTLGVLAMLWGARQLVGVELVDLVEIAVWLGGGVLLHDAVVAPLVLLVGYAVVRRLPDRARRPFVVAAVLLGSVTLAVLPTLGRFAAKPDDPYLLNRAYGTWWLLLAAALALGALAWTFLARRSAGRRDRAA